MPIATVPWGDGHASLCPSYAGILFPGNRLTVFCDLQAGIDQWTGNGALIYAGSKFQKFNLWIPDKDSATAQTILRLIETRYANSGRGYVYVSGAASLYPPGNADGKPQIVITDAKQLADFPPGE